MKENLKVRRDQTIEQCTQEARQLNRKLLFGMTTSLALQCVPLPRMQECALDTTMLHTIAYSKERRIRAHESTVKAHIWKPASHAEKIRVNNFVWALDLFHVWAQMAKHLSMRSLIVLGDSIVTVVASQPKLACNRTAETVCRDLGECVRALPPFKGKRTCLMALALVSAGSASPQESGLRLALAAHGVPQPAMNYAVPDASFGSGVQMTLDLAWPEYKIAVEYDGEQHRTDQKQWSRDHDKRGMLLSHGWRIFTATATTLASDDSRAEFAFRLARALSAAGAQFDFRLNAMSLEQLSAAVRKL
ncbi:hypothetical protein JS530_10175 [Bifidobacterium sp. LC6]|uniref:DUF559 domain-containing protein n=2 Tax=Bifidobacterium colobi TaxID=2809026 RepID=A0ABS5UXN4_9BIFI|nr:hypothetical protein [Bifidobacterium colobi]